MSQSGSVRGALDEAGDIRHHKTPRVLQIHDAQNGLQSREMIVGDAGPGVAGHGEQGGLSYIRKSHQSYVRDHFELQQKLQCLGGLTGLGVFGCLHGGSGIVHVAVSSPPAAEDDIAPQITGHVRDDLAGLCLSDHGSLRDLDLDILALFAGHSLLFPVLAVLGSIFTDMTEVGQRVQAFIDDKYNIAALSSVPSVGTARGDIFFPAERDMAVAAFAA